MDIWYIMGHVFFVIDDIAFSILKLNSPSNDRNNFPNICWNSDDIQQQIKICVLYR